MIRDTVQQLLGRLDVPMLIVTTATPDGERSGCLVGFATQSSIDPPRFLACISRRNRTFDVVARASTAAVHFLGPDQKHLAELFGGETGDDVDKFELCEWKEGPQGVPVLVEAPGWFVGEVLERIDLGDHVGLALEPVAAEDSGGRLDLTFRQVKSIDPGHEA